MYSDMFKSLVLCSLFDTIIQFYRSYFIEFLAHIDQVNGFLKIELNRILNLQEMHLSNLLIFFFKNVV